ncbi:MAG TPA: hypothetical protein VN030_10825 [Cellvibrio sp.]|nr:hypothetical protein [Cellvibrio sp.]
MPTQAKTSQPAIILHKYSTAILPAVKITDQPANREFIWSAEAQAALFIASTW